MKIGRVAHPHRAAPYPSTRQSLCAFEAMPAHDEFQLRDKSVFAFFMLTGALMALAFVDQRTYRHRVPTVDLAGAPTSGAGMQR